MGRLRLQESFREGASIWTRGEMAKKARWCLKKNGGKIHITFTLLAIKVYNSEAFGTLTKVCSHQQYLILGQNSNPPERTSHPLSSHFHSSLPRSLASPWQIPEDLLIPDISSKENHSGWGCLHSACFQGSSMR